MSFLIRCLQSYEPVGVELHLTVVYKDGHDMVAPVIIIGMHRSGTSMISRILEDLGLFMGKKKQQDHEALFFLDLNNWLMLQCGGAWDQPQAIHTLLEHREARSLADKYIRFILKTPRVTNYLGWKEYLYYRLHGKVSFPWGWKDPRNTFTLPLWLDIYPDAKVIHICRHGVDVASSLCVREHAVFNGCFHPINDKYRRLLYCVRPKKGGFAASLRCATLEGGFSLWEEYLAEARTHVLRLQDRALEIKYEEFLEEPHTILKSLAAFSGLTVDHSGIARAAEQVKKSRANAFKRKPELVEFSEKAAARLQRYGY